MLALYARRPVFIAPKGCGLFQEARVSMRTLSTNPENRLGVYKRLADVPEHHRLRQYRERYTGRDVWAEYVEERDLFERYDSDRYERATTRAVNDWKSHVEARDHHHALSTPEDVNTWCETLCNDRSYRTVYNLYWTRLAAFYEWLHWHTNYPHTYDPFLMAAHEYADSAAGRIWDEKIKQREER